KSSHVSSNRSKKEVFLKRFLEEYYDLYTFKSKPINEDFLRIVAQRLKEYADLKESYRLDEFYHSIGMGANDFYRFVEKYEFMKHARDYAKAKIAARREVGALKNKLNAAMVMKYQPLFDDEVKKLEEWRAQLREKEKGDTKIEVIIPPVKVS